MGKKDFPIDKIPDDELRRIATEGSKDKVSVIIQLDLPVQQVDFKKVNIQNVPSYLPSRVKPETPEEQKEIQRKTDAAKSYLEKILGTSPKWLRLARAFVAHVDGEQLCAIARSSFIKTIQPNRRLKRSRVRRP